MSLNIAIHSPVQITISSNGKLIKVVVDVSLPPASSELVFAQDLNHRLTEHCGEGSEAEGEAGGEDGLEAVHDEAVEAVEAVYGAQDHVQAAHKDGGNTTEEELRESMRQINKTKYFRLRLSYEKYLERRESYERAERE